MLYAALRRITYTVIDYYRHFKKLTWPSVLELPGGV